MISSAICRTWFIFLPQTAELRYLQPEDGSRVSFRYTMF